MSGIARGEAQLVKCPPSGAISSVCDDKNLMAVKQGGELRLWNKHCHLVELPRRAIGSKF